jgi:putative hydrolase of HD superfamily
MKRIAELILEACFLKHLPRSGYQYLGAGKESVAEHVYMTMVIAYVLARMVPDANSTDWSPCAFFMTCPRPVSVI